MGLRHLGYANKLSDDLPEDAQHHQVASMPSDASIQSEREINLSMNKGSEK